MKKTIRFALAVAFTLCIPFSGLRSLSAVSAQEEAPDFTRQSDSQEVTSKIIHRTRTNQDMDSNRESHTALAGRLRTGGNGISYHGGPVILGTTHVYYIWYGNWSGNSAQTILTNLAQHIGGSSYFNINTTYYNGSGTHVTNSVSYYGSTTDNYSRGTSLSDADIQTIVFNAINSGRLSYDTNGVYFVLTSADVTETSGFCSQYCGWHTDGVLNNGYIKYAFIGDPDQCPSACEAQTTSPNNNPGADGMASIISHELEESVTDPLLNAWYDSRGEENADKCAWTFGTVHTAPNGSAYNLTLGGLNYLIQRNWVNASGGYCALSY